MKKTAAHTSTPATPPISTAEGAVTKAHGAVMATRPASVPFASIEGSGLPYLIHMYTIAVMPPAAPASIGVIATNTMLAGAAGGITAVVYMWIRDGKPDPSMLANGTLAGLVAITAPCAFVTAPSAVLIGGVAGVLVCAAVFFIERRLRIDDPVGAISVHGVNGLWGILSLGLLADGPHGDGWNGGPGAGRGVLYGDARQVVAQLVGGLSNFVAVGAMAYAAYKVTELVVGGHRVSAEVEVS